MMWLIAACTTPGPEPAQDEAEVATPPAVHMHLRYESATRARDAAIRGDDVAAKAALAELAALGGPRGLSPELTTRANDLAAAAAIGEQANDRVAIGRSIGKVAVACGSCHRFAGAGPKPEGVPLPAGEDLKGQMHRHQWAVDRMWEGLVTEDPSRWQSGVFVLLESPLTDEKGPPEVWTLVDEVRTLGRAGLEQLDPERRGELYGKLLTTCARCHTALGPPAGP